MILEWIRPKRRVRQGAQQSRFERLGRRLESPIERIFWQRAYWEVSKWGKLTPQVNIGGYRVDFALTDIPEIPLLKVVIELDGHDWHKTADQRNDDYRRDRVLMKAGWKVVRFTGAEIYGDCDGCIRELVDLVRSWAKWLR